MPLSGPAVHQQLMGAYNRLIAEDEAARRRVNAADEQRQQYVQRRGERLIDLARFYLPDLSERAVDNLWAEVRPRVEAIVRGRDRDAEAAEFELTRLQTLRRDLDDQLVRCGESLTAAMERQRELSRLTEQRLEEDPAFVELSDRAATAEAALERAEANLEEIEQDAAKKLPAYDKSDLFTYLRDRKFGTPAYGKRGFTRRMDRALARFINYADAKRSYDFLKRTPDQMRQIISTDRDALETVLGELERRRDDVAASTGLPQAIEDAAAEARRRDDILKQLGEVHEQIRRTRDRLTECTDPRGPHYEEAVAVFRELLETFDSDDLERRSRQTVDITDDQIVQRLKDAEDGAEAVDRDADATLRSLTRRREFLNRLGSVIQRFRAAGFDSQRSQFVGSFDITAEVDRAADAAERIDADAASKQLWTAIQSNQRWGASLGEQITNVATHPMTQVLINAMAHAAGGAMEAQARRAGRRRRRGRYRRGPFDSWGGSGSWGSGSWGPW